MGNVKPFDHYRIGQAFLGLIPNTTKQIAAWTRIEARAAGQEAMQRNVSMFCIWSWTVLLHGPTDRLSSATPGPQKVIFPGFKSCYPYILSSLVRWTS